MSISSDHPDFSAQDEVQLKKNSKDSLISYISSLRMKLEAIESVSLLKKRKGIMEREAISSQQYSRREAIEISNIPKAVLAADLEDKTLDILTSIGVDRPTKHQVHACHRLKNGDTIIKFTSRKFADQALHLRKKITQITELKGVENDEVDVFKTMYLNESLCKANKYLLWKVRLAYKAHLIYSYNFWKGKLSLKLTESSKSKLIGHITDLVELNMADEADYYEELYKEGKY